MVEIPLLVLAGALGSTHCLGMCGPFVLALGSTSPSWTSNLRRQLVYSSGRICTYAFFGAAAGFAGERMATLSSALPNVPALLAVLAGGLLVYYGLAAAGWGLRPAYSQRATSCLSSTFFASFLTAPGSRNAFLAGLFTGMLPCGLVYGFMALAASSASVFGGLLTMMAFGCGTAPAMVVLGCGGSFMTIAARRHVMRVAAWCVVAAGLLSLLRGLGVAHIPGWIEPAGCPWCD